MLFFAFTIWNPAWSSLANRCHRPLFANETHKPFRNSVLLGVTWHCLLRLKDCCLQLKDFCSWIFWVGFRSNQVLGSNVLLLQSTGSICDDKWCNVLHLNYLQLSSHFKRCNVTTLLLTWFHSNTGWAVIEQGSYKPWFHKSWFAGAASAIPQIHSGANWAAVGVSHGEHLLESKWGDNWCCLTGVYFPHHKCYKDPSDHEENGLQSTHAAKAKEAIKWFGENTNIDNNFWVKSGVNMLILNGQFKYDHIKKKKKRRTMDDMSMQRLKTITCSRHISHLSLTDVACYRDWIKKSSQGNTLCIDKYHKIYSESEI